MQAPVYTRLEVSQETKLEVTLRYMVEDGIAAMRRSRNWPRHSLTYLEYRREGQTYFQCARQLGLAMGRYSNKRPVHVRRLAALGFTSTAV